MHVIHGKNGEFQPEQYISKVGGEVRIDDLNPNDIQDGEYVGRNAGNRMEADWRQFDEYRGKSVEEVELSRVCCGTKKARYQKVFRFAEELKSGNFKPVNKEVNLLPPVGQDSDQIQPGAPIDNMEAEREMIKN